MSSRPAQKKTKAGEAAEVEKGPPHPRRVTNLLGHERAEKTLLNAWTSGRLPHAWLLTGPRGIGKGTLAYRFARFVLDGGGSGGLFGDGPDSLEIDAESATARQVAAGSHPDFFVLEPGMPNPATGRPSKDILVGHIRKAVHFCFMTPSQSRWRVVLVDPADSMNPNAANALLKVLEEPPPQALLLLVSHAPAALLPTIRSRCAQLAMPGLPEETVRAQLNAYAPDLAEMDALALARLADGSPGRAISLHDAGGLDLYRDMVALLDVLSRGPGGGDLHRFAERLSQSGEGGSFQVGGDLLSWWLARLTRAKAEGRLPPEVIAGESETMGRLLQWGGLEQWLELWEKITHLFGGAERGNLDRRQVTLTALLEIEALAA